MAGQKNFGLLGKRKSTPKMTRINGDDNQKAIYRNLGNNHAYPFIWSGTVTHSGTSTDIASSIKFHGYDLATYGTVIITPIEDPGAVRYWVDKNTSTNVVSIKSSGNMNNVDFDVMFMLGEDANITGFECRGFGKLPIPSY